MDIGLIVALLVLGAAVGFAAGLLGIGGGMLSVPFITMILTVHDFPAQHIVHTAIATSLASILFTSIASMRAHHRRGAVRWRVAALLAPGILLGSWIGPGLGARMSAALLGTLFALFVALSATQMFLDKKPAPSRQLPRSPGMFGIGVLIGILSGLVVPAVASSPCRSWSAAMSRCMAR